MPVLYFITFVFERIRMAFGMLLPIFSDAADLKNWPRWMRWGIHLLLLGLVLWGLWLVQNVSGWSLAISLNSYLDKKAGDLWIKKFWLDLVFLVLYALCWVGYGLFKLFAADDESSEFPDLDRAWKTAVSELDGVGIRINDPNAAPPMFLVLGKPVGGMDSLFRASGWNFQYRFPSTPGSRLLVYACFDPYCVFVTLPDASGWTYLCNAVNGDTKFSPAAGSAEAGDPTKTLSFNDSSDSGGQFGLNASEHHEFSRLQRLLTKQVLSDVDQDRLELLGAKIDRVAKSGRSSTAAGQAFAIRTEVLRTGERELKFICSLMRRDRWPLCPINGTLVLLPWATGETENIAQVAARELASNLTVARNALQLHYPTIAAVCDMEVARGFGQFRGAFSPEQLKQRIGQRIPLVPVRSEAVRDTAMLIHTGIRWIAHAIVPVWVLGALRFDAQANREHGSHPNRDLYLMLREVQRRVPRFAAVLERTPAGKGEAVDSEDLESLPLFGGCYLTGTGDKQNRQAFVTGVFQRLVDDQASVAWTHRAYADDRRAWRITQVGYGIMGVIVALAAAFIFFSKK
ncbi:MAG TPA: type VI secretion protein IcmF/TssM N-terminal domain-containing protein [Urbifossiella sp.]